VIPPEVVKKEKPMPQIDINIDRAEGFSQKMAEKAEVMRQARAVLNTRAQSATEVWKCDAEMEFQDLHAQLMLKLDRQIERLVEIRSVLDNAISAAKEVDRKFGG
jgi:uncharacterized protein YukE